MSTYKFMAGLVETIGGEEDDYDPHMHRVIPNPTSYLDTMTHLLKASIGAGILAMPQATRGLGIIYSAVTLILVGIFATYCMQLLIMTQYQLCKRHRRGYMAYPKSMRYAINDGPPCFRWSNGFFSWFVESTLVIWQLGICTIFLVFVAENVKQICDFYGKPISLRMLLLFFLPPTIILNLVKDLKLLSPLSSISNLVTIFGIILVFFYLIEDDLVVSDDKLQLKELLDIPNFLGTSLFALEAVGVVLALEYNMKNPKQFVGLTGLFNIGMSVIITLYLIVGIFGYLKYGDNIKASITLNLPQNEKKAQTAKILFAFAIFLSFPLQNFVVYTFLWRRIQKRFPGGKWILDYAIRVFCVVVPSIRHELVIPNCCWCSPKWRKGKDLLLGVMVFLGTAVFFLLRSLAIALPRLGPFICLFGALCLSLLAMIFPAIMSLCLYYDDPGGYGPVKYRLFRDVIILIFGIAILISGVYSSINDILKHS